MSIKLETLHNESRPYKGKKRLGRGPGSKKGKTCGRGIKGAGSRSGWKARHGKEGGGVPLYRRSPTRGFSNARFAKRLDIINLERVDELFEEGETVSVETLREKGYIQGPSNGVKILGKGALTKKLIFQIENVSAHAKEKLNEAGVAI
jgi:large subunit ribosomal protein L15